MEEKALRAGCAASCAEQKLCIEKTGSRGV